MGNALTFWRGDGHLHFEEVGFGKRLCIHQVPTSLRL